MSFKVEISEAIIVDWFRNGSKLEGVSVLRGLNERNYLMSARMEKGPWSANLLVLEFGGPNEHVQDGLLSIVVERDRDRESNERGAMHEGEQ